MYNSLDLIVLIVLSFFSISGLVRGFVWEVTKILSMGSSLTLSMLTAFKFGKLGHKLDRWLYLLTTIGFPIVVFFIVGYFLLNISSKLSSIVKKSHFKSLDRFVGFIFGFIKACIIIVAVIIIVSNVYPDFIVFTKDSKVYNLINSDYKLIIYIKSMLINSYEFVNQYLSKLFS